MHSSADRRVAGAAAEISRDALFDLQIGWFRVQRQQPDHRHHEARRAETALQAVAFVKGLLDGMKWRTVACEPFDGGHVVALGLNGEHKTRADRGAVEQHRAASAHSVLATDVGSGQAKVVTQMVREEPAGIAWGRMLDAVDPHAANARSLRTRTR